MSNGKLTHPDLICALKEMTAALEKSLISVKEIWDELGVSGEAMADRISKYKSYVVDLVQEMQDEEERNKMIVVEKIERYHKESCKLRKELNLRADKETDVYKGEVPLHQVEITLREELRKIQSIKEARMEMIEELERREEQLLAILGQHTKYQPATSAFLSEDNIQAFRTYVQGKEMEREHLQMVFEETRLAILNIFEELELQPSLPLEKRVVSPAVRSFILSSENMAELKALHQSLEQKLADAKDESAELREKLSMLWERLQICVSEREAFLENHKGYSSRTIQALKMEVKRCEELKSANIAVFVKQLREELISWWDRCRLSNEERNTFSLLYFNECTEDMLEMLELEVEKKRKYYENNRDIFELAEKRDTLWEKMHELEQRANDPNRLFTNRGGQLLKEEKERKFIQKELPKIEEELIKLLEEYERQNHQPFLLDGHNLAEFIKNQWDERNDNKECQKQQRKVTRNTQLNVESRLGTRLTPNSTKLKGNASRTPNVISKPQMNARSAPSHMAAVKRKADGTPLVANVSKKIKEGRKSSEKRSFRSRPRYSTSKVRRFGKGATRTLDASSEKAKTNKTRRNIMSRLPVDDSIVSGLASYSEFQDHLEIMSSKEACRSSVVPQRCLRERNTAVNTHGLHPPSPHPASVSTTTKLTLTPGRITSATHFSVATDRAGTPIVTVTPVKPPRRNGATSGIPTPNSKPIVRRTSTRLNLKSPTSRSPGTASNSKLTTPRGCLPIII